jgi:hypothetical protein
MHNEPPDAQAMEEYIEDSANLPDPMQPHADPAGMPPEHQPWSPVTVPEESSSMAEDIAPFV